MNDQPQIMGQSQILHNHQNYVVWPPYPPENPAMFAGLPAFNAPPPPPPPQACHPGRVTWKGNKPDKRKEFRRNDPLAAGPGQGYKSGLNPSDLQSPTNRSCSKGRRFHHPKKKFVGGGARFTAPFAPRNTTSFIIRAKKSGGIASLVSPCPVTPAILPTPTLSPSREVLVDMAKEEWGVDGYGSMKGLIRLRSGKGENSDEDDSHFHDEDEEIGGGCSGSDVEECVEFEKRLDHDLSRFEMIYPNSNSTRCGGGAAAADEQSGGGCGGGGSSALENRVDEQDTHIAQLEEENLTLKERIFLMERELGELRRRVQCLETDGFGAWRGFAAAGGGRREMTMLENVENDLAGDVCSEMSVGNGNDGDGDGDGRCDCV